MNTMDIDTAIESLKEADRDALMVAFEDGSSMHIVYVEGRFVGVNIIEQKGLIVENYAGLFSEGLILRSENE